MFTPHPNLIYIYGTIHLAMFLRKNSPCRNKEKLIVWAKSLSIVLSNHHPACVVLQAK